MTEIKEELVIIIKKRPDWFILFLTGATIVFIPIMAGVLTFQHFAENMPIDSFTQIFLPICFVGGEISSFRVFLWHYRGQEKVTMTKEMFQIEKKGSFLNFPDTYKLEKIKSFSFAEKKMFENMFNGYKLHGGQIQFTYFGETIKFGQTLKLEEAKEIIRKLNKKINNEPLTNAIANAGLRVR